MSKRKGILIQLTDVEGRCSYGETAPLPGRSIEGYNECLSQLIAVKNFFVENPVPSEIEKLNGKFEDWLGGLGLLPSVRFGIEMAILNLLADRNTLPLNRFLTDHTHRQLRINGLLAGSTPQIIRQAEELVQKGFTAFKLKVGGDLSEDIKRVQSVSRAIERHALLHIDANGAWTLNDAVIFGNEVGCAALEYVEDPFRDTDLIPEFFQKTTIPVAIDEPLQKKDFLDIKSIDGLFAVILKPTLIGGVEKTYLIMQKARSLGLQVVISSSFESSVGIFFLAQLAGCTARDDHAGLDTCKYFEEDLIQDESLIDQGKIDLDRFAGSPPKLRTDLLREVR